MTIRRSCLSILLAPLLLLLFAGCATTQPEVELASTSEAGFEEREDDPLAAAMFRYQMRLSADGTMPAGALLRAKRQRDELIDAGDSGAGVWPESWDWKGPGNIGGRIRPIVVHPIQHDTMWVGAASGGIWKTTNGGQLWQPLDDFLPSLAVSALVLDPTDPDTLFAGTGEGFFETVQGTSNTAAVQGAGIFRSADGGETWTQLPSTANSDFHFVNRLAIHPTNPDIIIAVTGTGIWRSTDGGDTWSQRAAFNALDVRMNPADPAKLVAGGHHEEDGPYYSTDGGLTWTQANGAGGHRQELGYAPSNPDIVYAAVSGSNDRIRIWKSIDGGQNYTLQTTSSGISTYASYNNTLWVDPTNPDILIVGGIWLYRSTNGGVSLSQQFNSVHADQHNIIEHPGFDGVSNRTVFFGCDGGLHRTDNVYGSSSFDLNNNLGITQFYGCAINPDTGHIIGGTQDNGTLFYSGDPQDWDHIFGGDGGYAAADPTDPNYFYCEVQRALIHRSTNGGQSSSYIWNTQNPIGDAGGLNCNFIPFFMLDPNDPSRMLVGCRRLWRSNNVKANSPDWFSIKQSIEPPGPDNPGGGGRGRGDDGGAHFAENSPYNIATIAVAEGNSDIVWVGHNNGELWMTNNGTAATPDWAQIEPLGGDLPDRWPSTIVIDRADHDHVYVAFMGWHDDNLWESTDGGQTWVLITTGTAGAALPEAPISALALHRDRPGWLYAGTDVGMFTSGDNGQTWSTQTDGPGTAPVEQLIWKNDSELMAVTHGRGAFVATVKSPDAMTDFEVIFGTHISGGLAELEATDDAYLHVQSQIGFSASEPNIVEALFGLVSGEQSPSLIDVIIESRLNNPGGLAKLRLRNWQSGQLELVHTYATAQSDQVEVIADLDAADRVRVADGRMELSLRHAVIATFAATGFESFIDRINVFSR